MRRVIALEFVGLKQLDCDLYDESGNVVYEKSTELTPELLMKLNHMVVFKRDEEKTAPVPKPVKTKKAANLEEYKNIKPPEPLAIPEKVEYKTIIDNKKVEKLINTAKEILYSLEEGRAPKTAVCMEATQSILDEVYEKFDKAANVCELRINDYYTYTHGLNTAVLSAIIGRELGFHENKVKDLTFAGLLHDIGKISISPGILYKPDKLTPDEFKAVKNHSKTGYDLIIKNMDLPDYVARGALEHHERWNGGGYPQGIKGEEICEFGQIIAIADVFDALISDRAYRRSVMANDAIRIMLREESESFNPEIFHKFAFLTVVKTVKPGV